MKKKMAIWILGGGVPKNYTLQGEPLLDQILGWLGYPGKVVWASNLQDGSSLGVFGQRYNMIVPVELMHFRVE